MKIHFARHGRTNYNDLHLCNADPTVDVHLTPQGIAQAEALAAKLAQTPIDYIFVSQLRRTQQTADIVNKFHNLTIKVDSRLNDHRSGFEGQSFLLLKDALDKADNRWMARFNGGESIEDIKTRVADFLDDLKTKPCDSVLIVTSQWVIQAAVAIIQNISNEDAWALDIQQGESIILEM